MDTRFNLQRFIDAQDRVYEKVREELLEGVKRTDWMLFIFPQIEGRGNSVRAQELAIGSLDEAVAYMAHPLIGPRLIECAALVAAIEGRNANQIFGYPDDMKFGSSMTLFSQAAPEEPVFRTCIDKYFGGVPDELTMQRLRELGGQA
ncbi:MAG: DUF1810 domain-containing protein [Telluria sp.]|nr:DUF1810 domain-containing protein [Telluria sp.]